MRRIQSKKHKIGTYELNKISLSCFDDERLVLDDSVQTIAYFHQDYKKQKDILKKFSHMIINKKRFSQMIIKDSHK